MKRAFRFLAPPTLTALALVAVGASNALAEAPKSAKKELAPGQVALPPGGLNLKPLLPHANFTPPSQAILIGLLKMAPLSQPEKKQKVVAISGTANDSDFEAPITLTPSRPSAGGATMSFYHVAYVNNDNSWMSSGIAVMGRHPDAAIEIGFVATTGRRYLLDCLGYSGSSGSFNVNFTAVTGGALRPPATIPAVNGHATFVLTGASGQTYVSVGTSGVDWSARSCELTTIH